MKKIFEGMHDHWLFYLMGLASIFCGVTGWRIGEAGPTRITALIVGVGLAYCCVLMTKKNMGRD